MPGKPVVSMPATNLNIGMDLWNASAAAAPGAPKMRANASGASSAIVPAIMPEQWIQVWNLQLIVFHEHICFLFGKFWWLIPFMQKFQNTGYLLDVLPSVVFK